MEETSFKLCNRESDFTNHFGVNLGYQISYKKVDRCYFLSSNAKQLYRNICHHAYSDSKKCSFSQSTLRDELDFSKGTINTYLKELVDTGLIIKGKHTPGGSLSYYIAELQGVPLLIHSEMIHQVRETLALGINQWIDLKKKYSESSLYITVSESSDPLSFKDLVIRWFENMLKDESIQQNEDECESNVKDITPTAAEKSMESNIENVIPTVTEKSVESNVEDIIPTVTEKSAESKQETKRTNLVKVSPAYDSKCNVEEHKVSLKGKDYSKKELRDWNATNFCEYFAAKFKEIYEVPYLCSLKDDRVYMNSVLRKPISKEDIKDYIDMYLDSTPKNPSIQSFSCGRVLNNIQLQNKKVNREDKDSKRWELEE